MVAELELLLQRLTAYDYRDNSQAAGGALVDACLRYAVLEMAETVVKQLLCWLVSIAVLLTS